MRLIVCLSIVSTLGCAMASSPATRHAPGSRRGLPPWNPDQERHDEKKPEQEQPGLRKYQAREGYEIDTVCSGKRFKYNWEHSNCFIHGKCEGLAYRMPIDEYRTQCEAVCKCEEFQKDCTKAKADETHKQFPPVFFNVRRRGLLTWP
ncbi:hypothetical protein JDV02_009945 [Purpureocillium takamizusanense]|uniref:Uncharacterized protein n=1 Tax=Purpureocillium takamizusanense TaxID=2060973 RepID=A0A9Q8QRQ1_9HYPO|nr:uncharacterized protein JDV02_009945 [Purpureocillium takamizusanense]UNI24177.1 hypothetical protein JDV02_009945 [Purpureocillium takamizusanense]